MTAFNCEYPGHEGDRFIQNALDRYIKKVTYRRVDGQERRHEQGVMALCKRCVELDAGEAATDRHQGKLL